MKTREGFFYWRVARFVLKSGYPMKNGTSLGWGQNPLLQAPTWQWLWVGIQHFWKPTNMQGLQNISSSDLVIPFSWRVAAISIWDVYIYIYIWVSPTPHDDNSQPQKCSKNRSGLNCWFCKWLGEVIFLVFCNQNLNQGFWGDFEGYQPCLGQSYTKPRSFQPFPGRVASGSTTCAQQRWALLNLLLAPGRWG